MYTWHGIYGPLFEWRKKFPDDRPEAVKDFENMVHVYWGTMLSVDESVGRLRAWLEETSQLAGCRDQKGAAGSENSLNPEPCRTPQNPAEPCRTPY